MATTQTARRKRGAPTPCVLQPNQPKQSLSEQLSTGKHVPVIPKRGTPLCVTACLRWPKVPLPESLDHHGRAMAKIGSREDVPLLAVRMHCEDAVYVLVPPNGEPELGADGEEIQPTRRPHIFRLADLQVYEGPLPKPPEATADELAAVTSYIGSKSAFQAELAKRSPGQVIPLPKVADTKMAEMADVA